MLILLIGLDNKMTAQVQAKSLSQPVDHHHNKVRVPALVAIRIIE